MRRIQYVLAIVTALAIGLASAAPAQAECDPVEIGFNQITSNSGSNFSDQFLLEVSEGEYWSGDSKESIVFKFMNDGSISATASITAVFFGEFPEGIDSLFAIPPTPELRDSGGDTDGPSFAPPSNPDHPPGWPGGGSGWFGIYSADSDSPSTVENGVESGEWLEVELQLAGDYTCEDVLQRINDRELEVGIHVQSLGPYSETFVLVPETGAIAVWASLFGIAGAFGWYRRRRAK